MVTLLKIFFLFIKTVYLEILRETTPT